MSATTYGPSTPAFTPARVTRIAKQAAPELRWSSEKGARGVLVRVWNAPEDGTLRTELHLLNEARRLINATDLSASVVSLRSRKGRPQFRILVTSEAQEAAQMQERADARQAALRAAAQEVKEAQEAEAARAAGEKLTVSEAHAVITGTADDATAAKVTVREAAALERADSAQTEWVVYCTTHRHYLRYASAGGTTWTDSQEEARRYTKAEARRAAESATWLDHKPVSWPLPSGIPAELDRDARPSFPEDAPAEPAAELTYRSIRSRAYEVLSGGQVIGRVARTVHSSDALLWEAFRPGGGSAGHGQTRPEAARTLLRDPAAEPAVQPEASLPCWHVETAHGALYGVAALTLRDALQMTQDRLTGERSPDLPKRGQRVGTWRTAYGTVLCYRGPAE